MRLRQDRPVSINNDELTLYIFTQSTSLSNISRNLTELIALIIITEFRHFIKLIKYVSHRWSVFRLDLNAVSYQGMY